jgi:hypothetical protein
MTQQQILEQARDIESSDKLYGALIKLIDDYYKEVE